MLYCTHSGVKRDSIGQRRELPFNAVVATSKEDLADQPDWRLQRHIVCPFQQFGRICWPTCMMRRPRRHEGFQCILLFLA